MACRARLARIAWACIGAALAAPLPASAQDADPGSWKSAVEASKSVRAEAAKAKPGEPPEIVKGLRASMDALLKHRKTCTIAAFTEAFNETASLLHFHKVKGVPEYIGVAESTQVESAVLRFELPAGRGWSSRQLAPGLNDQKWGTIEKKLADGRVARQIHVWGYKWNTTYSDVGGENAKGLAEGALLYDRLGMTSIESRSNRVVMKPFSKVFTKAAYYEVVGEDEKLGPVRRRNYYVKGAVTTFNFEIVELRPKNDADSPFDAWQFASEVQETDFVIESMDDGQQKKK